MITAAIGNNFDEVMKLSFVFIVISFINSWLIFDVRRRLCHHRLVRHHHG
jgi:hypothetical protein